MLVSQSAADADGQLVTGEVQLHHLVTAQLDAAAVQKSGQALGLGNGGDGLTIVGDGDALPGGQQVHAGRAALQVHAAKTAAQGQVARVQLLRVLGHHVGAGAIHQNADGVQRGDGGVQRHAYEDGGGQRGHGRQAHQPVAPQRRREARQGGAAEEGAPAGDKAGAEKVVIHLLLVSDHSVPRPGQPVTHGTDAAAHKARKTVRSVVDGLAHGNGSQFWAAAHRCGGPSHRFDSFHSTSQYGRSEGVLNSAAKDSETICNFCYRSEILVEYNTIWIFCQVLP